MKKRISKFSKIQILTVIALLLFALTAYAQEMDLTEMSLDDLIQIEIDTVYTASKYEQKVTEAPSSISIVTAEDIKTYGYRDIGDILQSIRGFHVTNDRNYKYLGVRGFGLPSDYNNRILVLIDGIRHNDVVYDAAGLEKSFPINVDDMARIEVVRGPSSSLYGTSAFFAVVNVITKVGEDLNGAEVAGSVESFETYTSRFTYGNTFDNGLDLYVSASYSDSEGDDHFYEEFNDPSTNNGIAEGRDYLRDKKLLIKTTYEDFTLEGFYSHMQTGIPTAPWAGIFNSDTWTYDEYFSLDLKYERTYDNEMNVLARINYNRYDYYGEYPYEGDMPSYVDVNIDSADAKWIYGELQVSKVLMEKHRVTAGGSYTHNKLQSQDNHYVGPSEWGLIMDDKRRTDNWAVFLQDEFTITNNLILNLGVRYDDFESFGDTTNPRAALIYSPLEKTTIKGIYGSAFRAPTTYELYYHDADETQKASPDLQPEEIETFELVLEQYIGDNLLLSVAGFYNTIEGLIQQESDPADICGAGDPCLVFVNKEETEAQGIEFELEGKWQNGYSGSISYTYQETKDKVTGDILTNSPRNLAKANLRIPIYKEKVFLGIEEQFTGERTTLASNEVDGFFKTNVTLFSQDLIKGLELSASVYNLFDETYFDPGAGEHEQDAIEQDGLTYRFKVAYKF